MRPAEIIRRSAEYLRRHGVESPREEAETLLMKLLGVSRSELYSMDAGLDARTARLFGRALCLRCKGTPLQHVTGEQQFFDLSLEVTPDVFVPRPETEVVALAALETIDGVRSPIVVDVGTGTGAIALVVKRRRPDARVFATDLSSAAVDLACSNAKRSRLEIDVRVGDLLDPLPREIRGQVDLIVSNPPYISEEEYGSLPVEVRAEPYQALVGGTDVHRRLVQDGGSWLRPGGWLVVEIGSEQAGAVRSSFAEQLTRVEVLPDLAGLDRVVRGARPASGPGAGPSHP